MARALIIAAAAFAAGAGAAAAAEPVMVQCGREYQAAKAAGTLGGQDWGQFRAACAERLKAGPAAAPPVQPAAAASPLPAAAPAAAAAPTAGEPAKGGGMAAMHARQKQCGAEWRTGKAALVAATPGLTWPKFWSGCNARLKAAGG